MKKLITILILPLTIISLGTIPKWWWVYPEDAPDIMVWGFPMPYAGDGFHTSMSFQIFSLELLGDLIIHFIFWYSMILLLKKAIGHFELKKIIWIPLTSIATLTLLTWLFIAIMPDTQFGLKRTWDMEVRQTGFRILWQASPRPDYTVDPSRIKEE